MAIVSGVAIAKFLIAISPLVIPVAIVVTGSLGILSNVINYKKDIEENN